VNVTRKKAELFVNDERLMWFARKHAIDKKERTLLPGENRSEQGFSRTNQDL